MPLKVKIVANGQRHFVKAVSDGNGRYPSIDFLNNVEANQKGNAQMLMRLIQRFSDGNPKCTSEQFHEAGDGVYRFASGRLRLYCFFDGNQMLLLTHGSLKKTQKTSNKDLSTALSMKNAYLLAQQNNQLIDEIGN